MNAEIELKRIYDQVKRDDGVRILIDRLWPRGISKEEAKLDYWLKDLAPSNDLRKWFNHEPDKYTEFTTRYRNELKTNDPFKTLNQLKQIIRKTDQEKITLLFAAKDRKRNNAQVVRQVLFEEGYNSNRI